MDINLAIERQRKPLLRIVLTMFAMIGLADDRHVERLSQPIYRAVLRLLQPAESAVRRLIVAAASSLVPPPPKPDAMRASRPRVARKARNRAAFRLFDPRRRFASAVFPDNSRRRFKLAPQPQPRVTVLDVGFDPRVPLFRKPVTFAPQSAPEPDDTVSAVRLSRRLLAIKFALDNLPSQARRYLRWQAKPAGERRPSYSSALRPGHPPGFRNKPRHKVDELLVECDWIARQVRMSDTS